MILIFQGPKIHTSIFSIMQYITNNKIVQKFREERLFEVKTFYTSPESTIPLCSLSVL